ncbi:MAG: NUDIX domain-containing protein [Ruminococcaceae bacterium]|nr:NUDIX domain-containing protein [Oscillospiraceae bacterium]
MQGLNLVVVYSPECDRVLLCRRRKEPYLGLSNFIGGHIEDGEDGLTAAYRELFEETSITDKHIALTHLMDFSYPLDDCYIEVYFGILREYVEVSGDENELYWSTLDRDFFDMTEFAGEGNMGHILEIVKYNRGLLGIPETHPGL